MNFFKTPYQSPLGVIEICCTDEAVTGVNFLDEEPQFQIAENDLTKKVCAQLDEYFSGQRKLFDLPMQQQGTPFQTKVWELLCAVPYGKTLSYMDLSKRYGDVKAIRAIASANGKNKIAIVVPCHRIIGSNASLTGYAGGLWRKQWLLQHEAKYHSGVQQLSF